jgi:hypothetical protein
MERESVRNIKEDKSRGVPLTVGLPVEKRSRFYSTFNISGDILIQVIEGKSNGDILAPFSVVGLEFVKFLPRVLY